jgi:hypothetical protein
MGTVSRFGKPWANFSTLERKALGKKSHDFASETPWNDQFFFEPDGQCIFAIDGDI